MTRTQTLLVRIAALCLLPTLALAHPGHGAEEGFLAGALHPAGGIDHIAGFILVGLFARRLGMRIFRPAIAALSGLLVVAGTSDSAGWQYAAGFMLTASILVAAGVSAHAVFVERATRDRP
jgi:urease accessory protein